MHGGWVVQVRLGFGRSRRSKMRESKALLSKSIRPREFEPEVVFTARRYILRWRDICIGRSRRYPGAREKTKARYILKTPPSPCTKYVGRLTIG